MPRTTLKLVNEQEATFECTFGRGCEGICCQNGRPGLTEREYKNVAKNLKKFLPHMLPRARALVEDKGIVTKRMRSGLPLVPVVDGWCVFFNQGCVLHKVGAVEGDKYKYKPVQCALFPLLYDENGEWYVRQHGYQGEPWDVFCLSPDNSSLKAVDTLQEEMSIAQKLSEKW